MCMFIHGLELVNVTRPRVGYKVLVARQNDLISPVRNLTYLEDKWNICSGVSETNFAGSHIFLKERDAIKWATNTNFLWSSTYALCVYKVHYKGECCYGYSGASIIGVRATKVKLLYVTYGIIS
jgi:hypothetical protein